MQYSSVSCKGFGHLLARGVLWLALLSVLGSCAQSPYVKAPGNGESSNASPGESAMLVRVHGVGETVANAEKNGLQKAVQEAYGVFGITDRVVEAQSDTVIDKSFSYSKGIVEGREILSSYLDPADGLYHVDMAVKVSAAKVRHSQEIIAEADAKAFSGEQVASDLLKARDEARLQSESFKEREVQARKLVMYLGSQFPVGTVEVGKIQILPDKRKPESPPVAVLDLDVSLNKEYLSSFCAAMDEYRASLQYKREQCDPDPSQCRLSGIHMQTLNWSVCMPGEYPIPSSLIPVLKRRIGSAVLCLNFLGQDGALIQRFRMRDLVFPVETVRDPAQPAEIAPLVNMLTGQGAPFFVESGHLVLTTRSYTEQVDLTKVSDQVLARVSSIQATLTTDAECQVTRPNI